MNRAERLDRYVAIMSRLLKFSADLPEDQSERESVLDAIAVEMGRFQIDMEEVAEMCRDKDGDSEELRQEREVLRRMRAALEGRQ
jgi:hypothetical protein